MSMQPIFSFVIVNFKSAKLLPDWFASLSKTQLLPSEYEVIIVNNDANEKEELDMLQQQYSFTLVHSESNLGFGRACNRGVQEASGEVVGFINPDTRFVSGDFHAISERFQNDPSIGIIGLKLLTQEGATQEWSTGTEVTLWDIICNNFGVPKSKTLWESTEPIEVDWVSGASLFMPKNIFQEINGFDRDFFLYFEDTDLCKRAKAQGKSVFYLPSIAVKHLSGQSATSKKQQKRDYYASQDLYFSKHRPKWEWICIKILRTLLTL